MMKSLSRTFALVSGFALFIGLSAGGCQWTECDRRNVSYMDNRDRKAFPDIDEDWVCPIFNGRDIRTLKHYEPPPPPPPPPPPHPDVGGMHPADPPGPKDPDGVVNTAIVLNSCFGSFHFYDPRVNWTINAIYLEMLRDQTEQAVHQRTECFKTKANGCEALRECVGIVQQINGSPALNVAPDPNLPTACLGDTGTLYAYARFHDSWGRNFENYTWFNCSGLGMTCDNLNSFEWCATPRTRCDPEVDTYSCWDTRPYYCEVPGNPVNFIPFYYQQPRCADYGLVCNDEIKGGFPDCVGPGPACTSSPFWIYDEEVFSYAHGVACEDDTKMRACVGRGEKVVDCAQFGQGFKCLTDGRVHCGLASECDFTDKAYCDGDSLVVCDAGRTRKIDCKSLGFTSCNAKHAACAPGVYDNVE